MRPLTRAVDYWSTSLVGLIGATNVSVAVDTYAAPSSTASFIERVWTLQWTGGRGEGVVLPLPQPMIVSTPGGSYLGGIQRPRMSLEVAGSGRIMGATLRPGALSYLFGGPTSDYTDRFVALGERSRAADSTKLAKELALAKTLNEYIYALHRNIGGIERHRTPCMDIADRVMTEFCRGAGTTRVSDLCQQLFLAPRTLQRIVHRHFGVTPKWLLNRYRIHAAARRLEGVRTSRHSDLAVSLGYFDESHFARDFGDTVGVTPSSYARACWQAPARQSHPAA
ncbi:helix-turn-helix domain-containing protein (plasmid) [Streptomycetaceae bacterium NBC_01309]